MLARSQGKWVWSQAVSAAYAGEPKKLASGASIVSYEASEVSSSMTGPVSGTVTRM